MNGEGEAGGGARETIEHPFGTVSSIRDHYLQQLRITKQFIDAFDAVIVEGFPEIPAIRTDQPQQQAAGATAAGDKSKSHRKQPDQREKLL